MCLKKILQIHRVYGKSFLLVLFTKTKTGSLNEIPTSLLQVFYFNMNTSHTFSELHGKYMFTVEVLVRGLIHIFANNPWVEGIHLHVSDFRQISQGRVYSFSSHVGRGQNTFSQIGQGQAIYMPAKAFNFINIYIYNKSSFLGGGKSAVVEDILFY